MTGAFVIPHQIILGIVVTVANIIALKRHTGIQRPRCHCLQMWGSMQQRWLLALPPVLGPDKAKQKSRRAKCQPGQDRQTKSRRVPRSRDTKRSCACRDQTRQHTRRNHKTQQMTQQWPTGASKARAPGRQRDQRATRRLQPTAQRQQSSQTQAAFNFPVLLQ